MSGLPLTSQCGRCKAWFHSSHVCAGMLPSMQHASHARVDYLVDHIKMLLAWGDAGQKEALSISECLNELAALAKRWPHD